jgi:molecular chaperone GrpE
LQAATSDVPEVVKLKEGSELTVKQFESVFAKFNIEAIDPIDQPFNPFAVFYNAWLTVFQYRYT